MVFSPGQNFKFYKNYAVSADEVENVRKGEPQWPT